MVNLPIGFFNFNLLLFCQVLVRPKHEVLQGFVCKKIKDAKNEINDFLWILLRSILLSGFKSFWETSFNDLTELSTTAKICSSYAEYPYTELPFLYPYTEFPFLSPYTEKPFLYPYTEFPFLLPNREWLETVRINMLHKLPIISFWTKIRNCIKLNRRSSLSYIHSQTYRI